MKALIDVDALHKLGAYGVLNEALELLGLQPEDVWVLPTARFKLRLAKEADAVKRHGPAAAMLLRTFVSQASELQDKPSDDELAVLSNINGLDEGELILIAIAARTAGCILVTGDKRALRALGSEARCAAFAEKLQARVVFLEQLLEALILKRGFAWVHERVLASPGTDTGISMAVAPGMGASEANALAGLRSSIEHLRKETGGLLASALPQV